MPTNLLSRMLYALLGAMLLYLLPWGLYFWNVQTFPDNRMPAAAAPPLLVDAYKLSLAEDPGREMQPQTPWSVLLWLSRAQEPFNQPDGLSLANQVARALLRRQPQQEGKLSWHLRGAAAAIWVTRHWSADDAASTALQEGFFGPQMESLDSASLMLFDIPADSLGPSEAAVLVTLLKGPSYFRCSPERLSRPARMLTAKLAPGTPYAPRLAYGFGAGCRSKPNNDTSV